MLAAAVVWTQGEMRKVRVGSNEGKVIYYVDVPPGENGGQGK